jgi:imidazolonepropionase-like amidohydrolase
MSRILATGLTALACGLGLGLAALACGGDAEQRDAGPAQDDAAARPDGPPVGPDCPAGPAPALVGAQVFDGTGAPAVAGGTVVTCGGVITAVGGADTPIPANAIRVAVGSMTVLPGLVDAHVHLGEVPSGGGMPDYGASAQKLLAAGVTAVRVVGDEPTLTVALRDSIDAGEADGPFLTTCGPMFTAPGGHPAALMQMAGYPADVIDLITRQVDSTQAARDAVDALAAGGVDCIKAILTDDGGLVPRLDVAVLAAIVDQAERHGLHVTVHTATPADVGDALAAGVRGLEHGVATATADATLVAQILDRGVSYVPTLEGMFAAEALSPLAANGAIAGQNALAMLQAGVPVAFGTDSANTLLGLTLGGSVPVEAQRMVAAGFTPAEVLEAMTRVGASLLVRADGSSYLAVAGTLETGKRANLVVVAGDPLADVAALADVRLVLIGGEAVVGSLAAP